MPEFLEFDDKQLKKAIVWYTHTAPKLMKAVARGYLNDMAFEIKETSKKTMDAVFDYKGANTRKYLESAVNVQKAKAGPVESQHAIVGVRAGAEDSRKFYKRNILARQEDGGELKQVKSRGAGYRTQLMLPARGVDPKKNIRFRKAGLVSSNKDISNPEQRMAAALKTARDKKKRYAVTPSGIYKVLKTTDTIVRTFKEPKTVQTPKQPWLKPASIISMQRRERIFKKNLNRQLKKFKMK